MTLSKSISGTNRLRSDLSDHIWLYFRLHSYAVNLLVCSKRALQSWVWVTGCWSGVAGRGRGP